MEGEDGHEEAEDGEEDEGGVGGWRRKRGWRARMGNHLPLSHLLLSVQELHEEPVTCASVTHVWSVNIQHTHTHTQAGKEESVLKDL